MNETIRKRKSDDVPEFRESEGKHTKLCDSGCDSFSDKQNGTSYPLATLKYTLHEISDSDPDTEECGDDVASEDGRIKCPKQTGAENDYTASPACSGSQATLVLSESEDDDLNLNQNNNPIGEHSHSITPNLSPRQLWRNTSLVGDAETIATIIPDVDSAVLYDALAKNRSNPDRLNIATVTVLESGATCASTGDATTGPEAGTLNGASNNINTNKTPCQDPVTSVSNVGISENSIIKKDDTVLENKHDTNRPVHNTSKSDDIFNQAIQLTTEFPHIDQFTIYELLEKAAGQDGAIQQVREALRALAPHSSTVNVISSSTPKPSVPKQDSICNDPLVRNDPVFRDMRIISKMFPEKDQNEIYALVEAHYYKTDRVQIVIEELLRGERNSQETTAVLPPSAELETAKLGSGQDIVPSDPFRGKLTSSLSGSLMQDDVEHLRCIFPDCDPNYIFERLEACRDVADRVRVIAMEMFESKNYPRLKDVTEKQSKEARKHHLQHMKFTLEEFLAKFPDPTATFASEEKEMKDSYKKHVIAQLKHDFPDFKTTFMTFVLEKHHFHLLPATKDLATVMDEILMGRGRSDKIMRTVPREEPLVYPEEPDEYFFYELWYTLNEQKIKGYFEHKAAVRKLKVEKARQRKELYECNCCFEDECLFEEMNVCADGHLFCQQCIARSVEAAFGEGKTVFPCLTGICEHQIPMSVLKEVLPSSMFSKVLRKLQEEEVKQADIPDLVDCPFCSFATIMSDPNDHVFRCLNPECLKDSCRLCREPNHVPLRCEEVEKQNETDMRTYIEKKVTEAMLRKCYRCDKRFVKDVGCNKMTCICGATSCYVCREPDIDYNHFDGNRCNEGDMNKLHQQEMERAAEEAKAQYLRDHPEVADLELKHDPLKQIPHGGGNMFGNDNNYDEEHSDRSSYSDDSYSDEGSDD